MYPRTLFPLREFPPRLFPMGIGTLTHTYADVLIYIQEILQASNLFGPTRAPILLRDEPYPINGGPCAYIMPGESTTIEPQHMGDGRYQFGFTGNVTVRVMDSSFFDYTQSDAIRLSRATAGLYRIAHKVIDLLDLQFAIKNIDHGNISPLFPNETFPIELFPSGVFVRSSSTYTNITQEPMILVSEDSVDVYRKAGNLAAIDLNFRFPYTVDFQRDETFDEPTGSLPIATNMADLLLAVKAKMLNQGFLNEFQTLISLIEDPFPLVGAPFAVIKPERFNAVEYDKYGAGRDYAIMEGTFTVSPIIQNITDITQYADNAMYLPDVRLSLYSCTQYLIEQLALSFLHDPDGNFLATVPLDLISIGKPRYYKGAESYVTLPLTFKTKYQEALT